MHAIAELRSGDAGKARAVGDFVTDVLLKDLCFRQLEDQAGEPSDLPHIHVWILEREPGHVDTALLRPEQTVQVL
jgi:hypothetical protein